MSGQVNIHNRMRPCIRPNTTNSKRELFRLPLSYGYYEIYKSGRLDSNQRPLGPEHDLSTFVPSSILHFQALTHLRLSEYVWLGYLLPLNAPMISAHSGRQERNREVELCPNSALVSSLGSHEKVMLGASI